MGPSGLSPWEPRDTALAVASTLRSPEGEKPASQDVVSSGGSAGSAPATANGAPAPPPERKWDLTTPYRGLGTWVDLYDFEAPGMPSPPEIVAALHARGVKTIFLQTGRWNLPEGLSKSGSLGSFLDESHRRGMKVVGWYLPGFANVQRDVDRSVDVWRFASPSGQQFDGFGVDIEDQREVGRNPAAFAVGVIDYSRRLREALPPGSVIAAIPVDAKNNERSPGSWAGFPWPEIGQLYDVIMPMAYWTVTKRGDCRSIQYDAGAYLRDVIAKTGALMNATKSFHPVGGIADCMTPEETAAFVNVGLEDKWIGLSVYDFLTTEQSPHRDVFWSHLARANALIAENPAR